MSELDARYKDTLMNQLHVGCNKAIDRKNQLLRRMHDWFVLMDHACLDGSTINYDLWEDIKVELNIDEH